MHQTLLFRLTALLALGVCFLCSSLEGQEDSSKAPSAERATSALIRVQEIRIEPSKPGPDTLCRLFVTLENRGEQAASLFSFAVHLGGESLEVYEQELHVLSLAPGAQKEIRLFNFWTTESGRPAPKNGELQVEVRLKSAQWLEIANRDGEEIWTPTGEVEGLPSAGELRVKLKP